MAKKKTAQKSTPLKKVAPTPSKTLVKRKSQRAQIVRRKSKAGNTYYYNKKTKKFSSRSSWYKYRTWDIKQRPAKKIAKVTKKREVLDIDMEASLYKTDVDKATHAELRVEANRLRLEQTRWRDRIPNLKLKKNVKKVRANLRRYARHIDNIEKVLGEYSKPKGFEEESYTIGPNVLVDNIYKWEAKKFVDELIDAGDYDTFVVQYVTYKFDDPISIGIAIDDLETEADMEDIYYFKITQNTNTRMVHVTLSH